MTPDELRELAGRAREAIPGREWYADMDRYTLRAQPPGNHFASAVDTLALCATGTWAGKLVSYLAAASPDRIIALLDERDEKDRLLTLAADTLTAMIEVASEARDEWDAAPQGMRAGKILCALMGSLPRYRGDIDAIHANIAAIRTALKGAGDGE